MMLRLPMLFAVGLVLLYSEGVAQAQDIVIDWTTKSLDKYPTAVDRTKVASGKVINVNNILYDYSVTTQETAIPVDDASVVFPSLIEFSKVLKSVRFAPRENKCQESLEAAKKEAGTIEKTLEDPSSFNPATKTGAYRSIRLSDTMAAWEREIAPSWKTLTGEVEKLSACTGAEEFLKTYAELKDRLQKLEKRVKSEHSISFGLQVRPGFKYTVTIFETHKGAETQDGKKSFEFTIESDQLTLSAGSLFTKVEARSYRAAVVPGQTENQLVVDNTGTARPVIGAFLNYRLPFADWETTGFAFSSGPVIDVSGGKSEGSRIGYFVGISLHLWHRLYLTPGVHVGEFADFPAGFTAPGQTIPANFGTLTPVKRWTGRFGFGVTYKTLSFDKLKTPQEAKEKAQKTEKEANAEKKPPKEGEAKDKEPKK